ncbi:MAG TPA: DoxX family protein [Mucilaginibacter sp.]|nr:DoxX family protein [Mucilaginibacter sp.]
MKALKITYWTTTAIVALMMVYSAYAYLTQAAVLQAFQHLGFPNYFRIELAVAKLIGAVLLLIPLTARIKEWAYAGFAFTFISAFIAHTASGDPMANRIMPIIFLAILIVSYVTFHKSNSALGNREPAKTKSPVL